MICTPMMVKLGLGVDILLDQCSLNAENASFLGGPNCLRFTLRIERKSDTCFPQQGRIREPGPRPRKRWFNGIQKYASVHDNWQIVLSCILFRDCSPRLNFDLFHTHIVEEISIVSAGEEGHTCSSRIIRDDRHFLSIDIACEEAAFHLQTQMMPCCRIELLNLPGG